MATETKSPSKRRKISDRPVLVQGGLTGAIYIVTRYSLDEEGRMTAHEKFNVTAQFLAMDYSRAEDALGEDLVIGYKELSDR